MRCRGRILPSRSVRPSLATLPQPSSHDYTVRTNVGDLVSGVITLSGVAGSLAILNAANTTIKTFIAYSPEPSQQGLAVM